MGRERNGQETEKKIRYANNIIKAIQEYPSSRLVGSQSLQQDSKPSLFFWPQCVSSFCNQEDYQCICWLASNHLDGWIQHSVVHSWSVDTDVFLTSLQNPNRLKFHSRSTPPKKLRFCHCSAYCKYQWYLIMPDFNICIHWAYWFPLLFVCLFVLSEFSRINPQRNYFFQWALSSVYIFVKFCLLVCCFIIMLGYKP